MALIGRMRVCGVCLAMLAGACSVAAQEAEVRLEAPDVTALVRSIVADLGSDDVTLRIDAQNRLSDAQSIRLRDIETAVKGVDLSPEQRRRVVSAAFVRFCLEPRAGMGIQSTVEFGERGLLLQAVVPGFPAAEILRAGDRILSVNGHAIDDITMMRPVVISCDPGDEVPVVLVRGGATLNLRVTLGRASDLNARDRFAITHDMLEEAWAFRVSSFEGPAQANVSPPIESGLPAEAWQFVGTPDVSMDLNDGGDPNLDTRFRIDARRLQNPDIRDLGVVAAGEARGAGLQIRWSSQGGTPNIRMGPGANMRVAPDANIEAIQADVERFRVQELTRIRESQQRIRARIEELRGQLGGANDAKRQETVEQIGRLQRRIDDLEGRARMVQQLNP